MKINIEQSILNKYVNIVQRGTSLRTSLPILEGILLEAKNGKLKLTSTDLEIGIETFIKCSVEEEGSIVINSRIFGDIIRKLPNDKIYISTIENKICIKCGSAEFNIIGNSSLEYPELPTITDNFSIKISADLFKSAIRQTIFATAQDETRPILTGILFEVTKDKASFVALDGYRLALRNILVKSPQDVKIVVPSKTLNELSKILEDEESNLTITLTSSHIVFNLGETLVYSRLLEGQYLNYKDIIRKEHKTQVIVNRKLFQDGLERASLLAKEEKTNLIKINILDGKMVIKSNSEIGSVYEEVPIENKGEDLNIAFNSKYIIDGIKAIDADKIQLNFMGSLNPCIINPIDDSEYTYLVLPVRLAKEDY